MHKRQGFPAVVFLGVAVLLAALSIPGQAALVPYAGAAFLPGPPPPPPTHSTGGVALAGYITCDTGCDSGQISITVNTTSFTESYDGFGINGLPDLQHLASAFASDFNSSGSPVTASAVQQGDGSWQVQFVSVATGAGTNYTITTSVSSVEFGNSTQSLSVTPLGGYTGPAGTQDFYGVMSGGHN
jgi:hypothetical protein